MFENAVIWFPHSGRKLHTQAWTAPPQPAEILNPLIVVNYTIVIVIIVNIMIIITVVIGMVCY